MQAVADTTRLVEDGVISAEQAREIEARAREVMVYLAINMVLCLGILSATGGLIFWLETAALVALCGAIFLVAGILVLFHGGSLYRMFGNAASLIGAGMLIGGGSLELIRNYPGSAEWVMAVSGLAIMVAAAWLLKVERNSVRFVTGAVLLMGVALHLLGIGLRLGSLEATGLPIATFHLYATVLIVLAGWLTDVRLVTALAILPFGQMLDTGTFYYEAVYVFDSPEPTLSILQMGCLVAACVWIAARWPERVARHARVLAVLAFVVANLSALVGSLWGDFIGETTWGPGPYRYREEQDPEIWHHARDAFRETAVYVPAEAFAIGWAVALAALVLWAAHRSQRGLFNTAVTFAGIHAYTQLFESFSGEPLAYVIGGITAIPAAWVAWRLDRWLVAKRDDGRPVQGQAT